MVDNYHGKGWKILLEPPLLAITLAMIIVAGLLPQESLTKYPLTYYLASSMFPHSAFANHGEEVLISLDNSTFLPLTTGQGNQLKVSLNYTVQNSSIAGQTVNAIMKLYTPNGTLIKTSSYPSGFAAQSSGKAELKSTLTDELMKHLIANMTFTNSAKTEVISNEISIPIDLQEITPEITTSQESTKPEQPPSPPPPQVPPNDDELEEETVSPNLTPSPEATSPGIMPPFG